jgi:hypothetical protein
MTHLISQASEPSYGGKVLLTPVHGAGNLPNTMDHLTRNDFRQVLFAN